MSSSARRALTVLDTIGAAERPLGVTEIARALDLAPATVFRGLDALERAGFVGRYQASSRYVLGNAVSRLRQTLFARFHIREACLPYLRQLAFASGEAVSLSVPVGWYALRLAAAPGLNEVTSSPPVGEIRPQGEGGAGLAMLAFRAPSDVVQFRGWARKRRLDLRPGLDRELRAIRERGYALEPTPFAAGRAALALPVRAGEVAIAAIAVEGPVLDLGNPGYHDDLPRWIAIVAEIEALIAARPALFANPFGHLDPDEIVIDASR